MKKLISPNISKIVLTIVMFFSLYFYSHGELPIIRPLGLIAVLILYIISCIIFATPKALRITIIVLVCVAFLGTTYAGVYIQNPLNAHPKEFSYKFPSGYYYYNNREVKFISYCFGDVCPENGGKSWVYVEQFSPQQCLDIGGRPLIGLGLTYSYAGCEAITYDLSAKERDSINSEIKNL